MVTLKAAATKKMRLRVVGYYQGEYMYIMSNLGLLLTFKDYGIVEQNEILHWLHNMRKKPYIKRNRQLHSGNCRVWIHSQTRT